MDVTLYLCPLVKCAFHGARVIDAGEYSIPHWMKHSASGCRNTICVLVSTSPTATQQLAINQKKWDELPDDLKRIVQVACKENQMYMMNDAAARSIDAMKRFEEMGKTLVVMPLRCSDIARWTDAWYEEKVKEDPTWLESANPRLNSSNGGGTLCTD